MAFITTNRTDTLTLDTNGGAVVLPGVLFCQETASCVSGQAAQFAADDFAL